MKHFLSVNCVELCGNNRCNWGKERTLDGRLKRNSGISMKFIWRAEDRHVRFVGKASPVPGEIVISNKRYARYPFEVNVTVIGDVAGSTPQTHDGNVDMRDLPRVAQCSGLK